MRLVSLKCQNCNAQLELDIDNLQAYCPYCKAKLMLDFDQLGDILAEKEKTMRASIHEEESTKRMKIKYEHETQKNERENKSLMHYLLGSAIVFLLIFGGLALSVHNDEVKHDQAVEALQQIEVSIEESLDAHDYDKALIYANKLRCDDIFSKEEKKTWDKKREEYIELIEEQKENYISPDDIFMPESSSHYKGKNYKDVAEQLTELGFTNITSQKSTKEASVFHKAETVEHMLIGGVEKFKKNDRFDMNAPIILYYYYEKEN